MLNDPFPVLLRQFFAHLRTAQQVSLHTITAYREVLCAGKCDFIKVIHNSGWPDRG